MFLLLFLVLFCVKCEDISNNYYVIEMPDDEPVRDFKKPFRVYWNVPTMRCKSMKVPFENLHEKYGIIQNEDDKFTGDKITILYRTGFFPSLVLENGTMQFLNGGVPQEGDIEKHLEAFRRSVEKEIPDPDFNGISIIDFESWKPVFRQNFGVQLVYKDVSYEIERKIHWWWPKAWIQDEAKRRYEKAARSFIQTTISVAKQMRPHALWGYYGYPYCFNMATDKKEGCAQGVAAENDQTYWLWSESTALYPSIYSSQDLSTSQLASLIRGRVKEASRVRRRGTPILPYFWYRYREGGFLSESDFTTVLQTLYKSNASGFIIWGSWKDLDTIDKCIKLRNYLDTTMGPAIAKLTKHSKFQDEMPIDEILAALNNESTNATLINTTHIPFNEINEQTTEQHNTTHVVALDPELHWDPPESYAQDIINYVEEEFKKHNQSIITEPNMNEVVITKLNESALIQLILYNLMKPAENTELNNSQSVPENNYIDDHAVNVMTVYPFKIENKSVGYIPAELDMNTKTSYFDDKIFDSTTENYGSLVSIEEFSTQVYKDEKLLNPNKIDLIDDLNTYVETSTINPDINSGATYLDYDLDFTTESHDSSTIFYEEYLAQFYNEETLFNPSNPDKVNKYANDNDNTTDDSTSDSTEPNDYKITPDMDSFDMITENPKSANIQQLESSSDLPSYHIFNADSINLRYTNYNSLTEDTTSDTIEPNNYKNTPDMDSFDIITANPKSANNQDLKSLSDLPSYHIFNADSIELRHENNNTSTEDTTSDTIEPNNSKIFLDSDYFVLITENSKSSYSQQETFSTEIISTSNTLNEDMLDLSYNNNKSSMQDATSDATDSNIYKVAADVNYFEIAIDNAKSANKSEKYDITDNISIINSTDEDYLSEEYTDKSIFEHTTSDTIEQNNSKSSTDTETYDTIETTTSVNNWNNVTEQTSKLPLSSSPNKVIYV